MNGVPRDAVWSCDLVAGMHDASDVHAVGGEVVVVLSDPEEDPAEGTAGRGGDEGRSRQTRSGRRDGANAEAGTSGVQGTQGRGGGAREARTAKKGGGGRGRKRGARTSRGVAKRSRNAKAARSDTPAQKVTACRVSALLVRCVRPFVVTPSSGSQSGKRRVSQQASSIEQDGEGQVGVAQGLALCHVPGTLWS